MEVTGHKLEQLDSQTASLKRILWRDLLQPAQLGQPPLASRRIRSCRGAKYWSPASRRNWRKSDASYAWWRPWVLRKLRPRTSWRKFFACASTMWRLRSLRKDQRISLVTTPEASVANKSWERSRISQPKSERRLSKYWWVRSVSLPFYTTKLSLLALNRLDSLASSANSLIQDLDLSIWVKGTYQELLLILLTSLAAWTRSTQCASSTTSETILVNKTYRMKISSSSNEK